MYRKLVLILLSAILLAGLVLGCAPATVPQSPQTSTPSIASAVNKVNPAVVLFNILTKKTFAFTVLPY
jgi:hypothetical protein